MWQRIQFVLIAAMLALTVMGLAWAQPGAAEYYVRVILDHAVRTDEVLESLNQLKFHWDRRIASSGELWGRLPAEALPAAEQVAGVRSIVLEAPPAKSPGPERYRIWFRIRLEADARAPNQRYVQYQQLIKHLSALGFKQDPLKPEEWRYNDILRGEISAQAVPSLIANLYLRTVLLVPPGINLEGDPKAPVFTEIWLGSGLLYNDQQSVWREARNRLAKLGFTEAYAYDNENGCRVLGWLPSGTLFSLLDVSHEYRMSTETNDIGIPPSTVPLFRVIEVLSEPGKIPPQKQLISPLAWPDVITPELKLSPEIKALIEQQDQNVRRLEIIFRDIKGPEEAEQLLRNMGVNFDGEGSLGPIVWVRMRVSDAARLVHLAEVSHVRLPQVPYDAQLAARRGQGWYYIGLQRPYQKHRLASPLVRWSEPMRVAVIGTDFRGWQQKPGKTLPRATYYLDYTRWMNASLDPEPSSTVSDNALAIAEEVAKLGAFDELYLVRIHESAPYQVQELLDRINGVRGFTRLMLRRFEEGRRMREAINEAERELRLKKAELLSSFRESDPKYWEARDAYLKEEKALAMRKWRSAELTYRLQELQGELDRLARINTVVIVPWWRDGYPNLADTKPGLRWLPNAPLESRSVIQVIPEWTEADWFGWLRDENGNEAVEFRKFDLPRWVQWNASDWQSRRSIEPHRRGHGELNWLGWRPIGAALPPALQTTSRTLVPHLPPQTTIELILQWKEVHDPRWFREASDVYRRPLVPWVLEVVRPVDETGGILPEDVYTVVARSQGLPQGIEHHRRYSIYEMRLRFSTADKPGRYAVRLRGRTPRDTSPPEAPQLLGESQEIWFRLSAEIVDAAAKQQGRLVWLTPPLQ